MWQVCLYRYGSKSAHRKEANMKSHHVLPFTSCSITVFAAIVVSRLAFATDFQPQSPWATNPISVPSEVQPFVEAGTHAIALGSTDIHDDDRRNYVLIMEKDNAEADRILVILIRRPDHSLQLAVRNEKIAMCAAMQGAGGGIELITRHDKFEIRQTIGSGMVKGVNILVFRYLKQERDWILTNFDRESFDATGITGRTSEDVSARHLSASRPLPEEFLGGCPI
jgi:hypothetical protein